MLPHSYVCICKFQRQYGKHSMQVSDGEQQSLPSRQPKFTIAHLNISIQSQFLNLYAKYVELKASCQSQEVME